MKRKEAAGISNAAVCAMERICDKAMPKSSQLMKKKDRKTGAVYLRTCRTRALKYQVCRSTGKHTNAVLSCLHWFQTHEKGFVENRNLHLNESGKRKFFTALQSVAKNDKNNLEMIRLSTTAKTFLSCDSAITKDKMHVRNFADLILIAINKNQTLVKAAAANYRKSAHFNVADTNK
jgi:DNA-directed RNA polymerase